MSGGDINKECMILQDFFKTRIQIQKKTNLENQKNKTKKFKVKRKHK